MVANAFLVGLLHSEAIISRQLKNLYLLLNMPKHLSNVRGITYIQNMSIKLWLRIVIYFQPFWQYLWRNNPSSFLCSLFVFLAFSLFIQAFKRMNVSLLSSHILKPLFVGRTSAGGVFKSVSIKRALFYSWFCLSEYVSNYLLTIQNSCSSNFKQTQCLNTFKEWCIHLHTDLYDLNVLTAGFLW